MGQAINVPFGDDAAVGFLEGVADYTGYKCSIPLTCGTIHTLWSKATDADRIADPGIIFWGKKEYGHRRGGTQADSCYGRRYSDLPPRVSCPSTKA